MKKWSSTAFVLSALAAVAVTVSGCSDNSKPKELMEQALAKQSEMKAYTFSGTADLNLDLPSSGQGHNPLTDALTGMLTKSKLEWTGAATTEPVRFETNIKSTPAGSGAPIELPVILKDNKLFLHIPLLNKQDEYYSINMAELGQLSGQENPVTADSLKNITKTASEATKLVIADINPKWFKKTDSAPLKDGSKASLYRLDITDKNRQELSDAIKGKLPQVAELARSSGILTQEQTEDFKKHAGGFELQAPGSIQTAVDEAGFIREQTVELLYKTSGSDGKEHTSSLKLTQTYNDINQEPKFLLEEPKNVRPLTDILKLLMPAAGKK